MMCMCIEVELVGVGDVEYDECCEYCVVCELLCGWVVVVVVCVVGEWCDDCVVCVGECE